MSITNQWDAYRHLTNFLHERKLIDGAKTINSGITWNWLRLDVQTNHANQKLKQIHNGTERNYFTTEDTESTEVIIISELEV